MAQLTAEVNDRLGTRLEVSPEQAMLDMVSEAAGNVAVLRAVVADLEVTGPDIITIDEGGEPLASGSVIGKRGVHIFVSMYNQERDRLVRYADIAARAGISERLVRIAEGQGRKVADALDKTLRELDLTPAQRLDARPILAKHLKVEAIG